MPKERIKFDEFVAAQIEESSIELEMPDGSVFTIPPEVLWPDIEDTATELEVAKAIIGEDRWVDFSARGGTVRLVGWFVRQRAQMRHMGESSAS